MGVFDNLKKMVSGILPKDPPVPSKEPEENAGTEPEIEVEPEPVLEEEQIQHYPEENMTADEIQNRNLESAKNLAWEIQQLSLRLDKEKHSDVLEEASDILDGISKTLSESGRITMVLLDKLDEKAVGAIRSYEHFWSCVNGNSEVLQKLKELQHLLTETRYITDTTMEKTRLQVLIATGKLAVLEIEFELAKKKVAYKKYAEQGLALRTRLLKLDQDHPDYIMLRSQTQKIEANCELIDQEINNLRTLQTQYVSGIASAEQNLDKVDMDPDLVEKLSGNLTEYADHVVVQTRLISEAIAREEAEIKVSLDKLHDVAPVLSEEQKNEEALVGSEQLEVDRARLERARELCGETGSQDTAEHVSNDVPTISTV